MATVLVVEDETFKRELVTDELREAGFSVVAVRTADDAIAILETRQDIHLVFTDIDMPGSMDGLKLAAAVRDRWPPVHIIITTGKASRWKSRPIPCLFPSLPDTPRGRSDEEGMSD
jgi:CheY-like chemotaxis protein